MNHTTNQPREEFNLPAVQLLPEIFNSILTIAGIIQMYHGIEISHPVYLVLFCNLVASLISSLIDLVAFPITEVTTFEMVLLANGVFYLVFHSTCWEVVSILRYVYIVHPSWIGVKVPAEKNLCRMSLAFVFVQYTFGVVSMLVVLTICGWPKTRVVHMSKTKMLASTVIQMINLIIPVMVSIAFSLLLIAKRGKLGLNKIDAQEVQNYPSNPIAETELNHESKQEVKQ